MLPHYRAAKTEIFTWAFVQQHWNPWPPSPDQSLAPKCNTYSPGSLNVASVEAFPRNLVFGGARNSLGSTAGRWFEKVTLPGPRNFPHASVTAGMGGGLLPGIMLASSATQTWSGRGTPTVAFKAVPVPRGP